MRFPNMSFVELYSIRLNHLIFQMLPQKISELVSEYSSRTSSSIEVSRMLGMRAFMDEVVTFLSDGIRTTPDHPQTHKSIIQPLFAHANPNPPLTLFQIQKPSPNPPHYPRMPPVDFHKFLFKNANNVTIY